MTQLMALHEMTQSEMTQSLAMHVVTQSLAMHVMTLRQTLCGHQVDRQHQNLCTENAFTWQMGRQSQACEQSNWGGFQVCPVEQQISDMSCRHKTAHITHYILCSGLL